MFNVSARYPGASNVDMRVRYAKLQPHQAVPLWVAQAAPAIGD